jgi:hypothetical protein
MINTDPYKKGEVYPDSREGYSLPVSKFRCFINKLLLYRIDYYRVSFISIKRYPQGANIYIVIHVHTMRN